VLVIAALGVAVIVAWLIARESPLISPLSGFASVAVMALMALGVSLAKTTAVDLRWDGRTWYLGPAVGEPVSGDLSVAIDLGAWMLLRFSPALPQARPRSTWLPVQRHGLEAQWHALRCAVYSPRPVAVEDPPVAF